MRILVVGAGIAGLSLARALHQRGRAAELIDRESDHPPPGAALFLPGNASRAIAQLGLLAQVLEKAFLIKRQLILDSYGNRLNVIETENIWRECGSCLSLPRRDFQDILMASVGSAAITFGRSIASISTHSNGCEVIFDDGCVGRYDLVVGADGILSTLRKMTRIGDKARYVGSVSWRFITTNTTDISCWTAMLGNGCTLLAIPVSLTEVYVYADLAVASGAIGGFSRSSPLRQLFKDFAGPVFPLIDRLSSDTQIHFAPIEEVRLTNWTQRRLALIGDAAHASSPSMAEGAGMAMEDALALAEELSTSADIDKALDAYVKRRKPRVTWVQNQCNVRDKVRSWPRFARDAVLRLFGNSLYKRSYSPLLRSI